MKISHKKLTLQKLLTSVALATAIMVLAILCCALIGTKHISIANLFSQAADAQTQLDKDIFFRLRLPRTISAAIVGASLACAGAVFQALLRNPLADPYILGISSGAGLGAITASLAGLSFTVLGRGPIAVFAFIGAFATVWLVWLIGSAAGKKNLTALLLTGVVINSFFSAIIMFLVSIARSQDVQSTMVWLMGNITEIPAATIAISSALLLVSLITLFALAPAINLISFSFEDAHSIGINSNRTRLIAFTIASFMTSIAVSLSGLIGFAGLIVPHAIRLIFGPDHRLLFPLSALAGAIFLVITDTFARTVIAPDQLPVGIITALLGGPFFIFLLIKFSRKVSFISK